MCWQPRLCRCRNLLPSVLWLGYNYLGFGGDNLVIWQQVKLLSNNSPALIACLLDSLLIGGITRSQQIFIVQESECVTLH